MVPAGTDARLGRHLVETLAAGHLALTGATAHHLAHVRRAKPGQALTLFDGAGHEAAAVVVSVGRDTVEVEVETPRASDRESPLAITLLFALSKGEKPEWIAQKAVELGVARLVAFHAARSVARWEAEKIERKLDRLRETIAGAAAQCGRNVMPDLAYAPTTAEAAARVSADCRLVLDPDATDDLGKTLRAAAPRSVALLCGPEGGWEPEEVAHLVATGWMGARLGPRILRAETATLAAVAVAQAAAGDLR